MCIIDRKIKDARTIWLISRILTSYGPSGRGMPIGALTSQLFANIYLNELDYFVKHTLKARYYVRYMDDFIILHGDSKMLAKWKDRIGHFLLQELKLELHPEKSRIYPLHAGIGMLGYRTFYRYKLLKKNNIRKLKQRMAGYNSRPYRITMQRLVSWMAYARYANTYNLRKEIMNQSIATLWRKEHTT